MTESEDKLKSLLMRVKEESKKTGLKLNIQKIKIMASGPSLHRRGKSGSGDRFYFVGLQNHYGQWLQPWKTLPLWNESNDKPRQHIIKQTHHSANKGLYTFVRAGWVLKNRCIQIVVLVKTLKSPLDRKKIKPVNPQGNHPWIFIGRTDPEAPILWSPDVKNPLTGKDTDAEKDWRQNEMGAAEVEMVRWPHWLNGHKSEQTLKDSEGQGSLAATVHGVTKSQTWLSDWTTRRRSP